MRVDSQRLDRWLWYARIAKSRSLASRLVSEGRCRVNGAKITKPAHGVLPGDVITLVIRQSVLVVRVLLPGVRRGPAREAFTLYENLSGSSNSGKGRKDLGCNDGGTLL